MRTFDNNQKIATGQGDDYTTVCLMDYPSFKEPSKIIATDLSKQEAVDANPKAIQQINLTENLKRDADTTMIFIIEEVKATILGSSQLTRRVLQIYFVLI